ncbi:hypothetical protein GCM10011366_13840 [Ornithinimicrobium tianjinense]|uniref:Uncharacterized protein n=1 Tax=Ornithinimicrobium tianjinense TaxID=1195761 RepID=A0A917BJ93_9MICO|nr:hypothetical protein GCM10011366_13840 [Ornithinimicrobium tianjinense]
MTNTGTAQMKPRSRARATHPSRVLVDPGPAAVPPTVWIMTTPRIATTRSQLTQASGVAGDVMGHTVARDA